MQAGGGGGSLAAGAEILKDLKLWKSTEEALGLAGSGCGCVFCCPSSFANPRTGSAWTAEPVDRLCVALHARWLWEMASTLQSL